MAADNLNPLRWLRDRWRRRFDAKSEDKAVQPTPLKRPESLNIQERVPDSHTEEKRATIDDLSDLKIVEYSPEPSRRWLEDDDFSDLSIVEYKSNQGSNPYDNTVLTKSTIESIEHDSKHIDKQIKK